MFIICICAFVGSRLARWSRPTVATVRRQFSVHMRAATCSRLLRRRRNFAAACRKVSGGGGETAASAVRRPIFTCLLSSFAAGGIVRAMSVNAINTHFAPQLRTFRRCRCEHKPPATCFACRSTASRRLVLAFYSLARLLAKKLLVLFLPLLTLRKATTKKTPQFRLFYAPQKLTHQDGGAACTSPSRFLLPVATIVALYIHPFIVSAKNILFSSLCSRQK